MRQIAMGDNVILVTSCWCHQHLKVVTNIDVTVKYNVRKRELQVIWNEQAKSIVFILFNGNIYKY